MPEKDLNDRELYDTAVSAHRSGDFKEAVVLYHRILKKYPNHSEVLALLGELNFTTRNFESATRLMRQAIEANPFEIVNYLSFARMLSALKDFEGSIRVYEELIAKNFEYLNEQTINNEIFEHEVWNGAEKSKLEIEDIKSLKSIVNICAKKVEKNEYDTQLDDYINMFVDQFLDLNKSVVFVNCPDNQLATERLADVIVRIVDLINTNRFKELPILFNKELLVIFNEWTKLVESKLLLEC